MALLHNTTISSLRLAGHTNIAAANWHYCCHSQGRTRPHRYRARELNGPGLVLLELTETLLPDKIAKPETNSARQQSAKHNRASLFSGRSPCASTGRMRRGNGLMGRLSDDTNRIAVDQEEGEDRLD